MGGLILPPVGWRTRAGLDALCALLGPGQSRFVGGAVRDALLGIEATDIDLATVHPPDRVMALLSEAGIRVVPTGIAHGTVTAVLESGPVEITTLRRDVTTDGRHAEVAFTDDWQADASRRDFTINALYADPASGAMFDYFGGLDDLAARRVRFIGEPLRRIAEDHLRILRFFRFLARFGDSPDADGLAACVARANDLMALSRERISDELLKLLVTRHAPTVVRLMVDRGILRPVLPEITVAGCDRLDRLAEREAAFSIPPDPIRRLAALVDPAAIVEIGARLKLSNQQRKRLESAVAPDDGQPARALGYRLGIELARDRLLLSARPAAETASALAELQGWTPPRLPVSGGALIARGVPAGPQVARLLRQIEDAWIAAGFPDSAGLDAIVDAVLVQALRSPIS